MAISAKKNTFNKHKCSKGVCNLMPSFFQSPININIQNIGFRGVTPSLPYNSLAQDGFVSNPLYNHFADKARIEFEAKTNPRVRELMHKYNLPLRVNTEELQILLKGHLKNTRLVAAQIYSNLPAYIRKDVNLQQLQEAAILHDYGKILIPNEILNKKGALDQREREIMSLHSELGYELLKNKGLDENILKLIKYHHQNPSGNGYPAVAKDYEHSITAQILNAADEYTALREERCYKNALDKKQALKVIKEKSDTGTISPEVYQALEKAVL